MLIRCTFKSHLNLNSTKMQNRTQQRKPFGTASSMLNKTGPSVFSRNLTAKHQSSSKDKSARFSTNITKPSPMKKQSVEIQPEAEPEYEKSAQKVEVKEEKSQPRQSRNLEDILRSTNASLSQLKVELSKYEEEDKKSEIEDKKSEIDNKKFEREDKKSNKENITFEPVSRNLSEYHKELLKELREENHKLVIEDLRMKNELVRLKDSNLLLNTENSTLKERITSEKLKSELSDQEVIRLTRKNTELNSQIRNLEYELESRKNDEYKSMEMSHKDEIIKTLKEQLEGERDSRSRHMNELKLEIARNGKLKDENDSLKQERHDFMDTLHEMRKEIRYLKMSNQEAFSLLRYS